MLDDAPDPYASLNPSLFRPWILDAESGEPRQVDVLTWARWFEGDPRERIVLRDTLARGVDVSTVFLGLDSNWFGGPPILWETMIFGGPFDLMQRRYTSKLEALAGHAQLSRLVTCYFHEAPRRVKKALGKWARSSMTPLRPAEQRRVDRVLRRIQR